MSPDVLKMVVWKEKNLDANQHQQELGATGMKECHAYVSYTFKNTISECCSFTDSYSAYGSYKVQKLFDLW